MTDADGNRVVLLTGKDVAHCYVARILANKTGLAGIVCIVRPPRSLRRRMRTYLRRYGARGVAKRLLMRVALQASGENRRRRDELGRLLDAAEFPASVDTATTTGVNSAETAAALTKMAPDILCVYGTAVVRDEILSLASRIALNLHTGISPRYRGTDCAFWPLHNGEPEWVGATVHECTSAIDGGNIFGIRRATLEGNEGVAGVFAQAVITGADLYSEVVNDILAGRAVARSQDLAQGREYRAANRDWRAELRVHRQLKSGVLERRHASDQPMPRSWPLALICVTHRSSALLSEFAPHAVAAVQACGGLIVVVDSGSGDDTPQRAHQLMPKAEVLELDGNRGFAAGINAGIDHVRALGGADSYAVANPDVLLEPLTLVRLLQAPRPRPAIAVPQLSDRGTVLPSLSRAPSLGTTWAEALLGGSMATRLKLPTELIRDASRYGFDGPVGWATGGLMLIDGACADAVGPWDESYFMYDEEVDYSLRAAELGYPVWYVHDAHATRLGGADRAAPWAEALMKRNRIRTLARRRGSIFVATATAALVIGSLIRATAGRPAARAGLWALVTSASPAEIRARYGPSPLPEWPNSRSVEIMFSETSAAR